MFFFNLIRRLFNFSREHFAFFVKIRYCGVLNSILEVSFAIDPQVETHSQAVIVVVEQHLFQIKQDPVLSHHLDGAPVVEIAGQFATSMFAKSFKSS